MCVCVGYMLILVCSYFLKCIYFSLFLLLCAFFYACSSSVYVFFVYFFGVFFFSTSIYFYVHYSLHLTFFLCLLACVVLVWLLL